MQNKFCIRIFSVKIDKLILKLVWKCKELRRAAGGSLSSKDVRTLISGTYKCVT